MGISDKDYADAIEHQRVHTQAIKNLGAITGGITINSGAGTGATWASNVTVQQPYGTFKVLTEDDLNHEAMKAPLSALVDMWLSRWQGDWVSELIFQEDDFWRITLVRLTGANKLEKHNLASQSSPVYRIIE
jgi:hypothetical protein